MLKLENHIKLAAINVCIFLCLLSIYAWTLTYSNQAILRQHLFVHLTQIFVDVWAVTACVSSVAISILRSIRQTRILGNHTDYIHTEAIDSFVAPPGHHLKDFLANLRIIPV